MSETRALAETLGAMLDDEQHLSAPCGYLSTAPDGVILSVNETLLALTGYTRDELVGKRRFSELLSPGGRIYHETHLAPMLQMQGRANEIALELVCADARRVPVLVNSVLERERDGTPVLIRTAIFEATERREYERELLRAKQRAERSEAHAKALVRTLQQTLIPPAPPAIPGLDVATAYRPAGTGEEIGGDFYDIFEIGADDWAVVIGDVSGKGIDAAIVTSLARHTLRAAAVRSPQPSLALETLNQVLLHDATERFCTVAFLRLRRSGEQWTVTTSSGGHPLPLLLRGGNRPVWTGVPGSLIGFFDDPTLTDTETTLETGDTIVLYTDGVIEGRSKSGTYGDERLHESLVRHAGTATVLVQGLLDDAVGFQSGNPRDDIAIVAIHVPPPAG